MRYLRYKTHRSSIGTLLLQLTCCTAVVLGCNRGPRPSPVTEEVSTPLLSVSSVNPRYFTDGSRAIYLTGSHNPLIVDKGDSWPPRGYDWASFLDYAQLKGHNFIRVWTWSTTKNKYDDNSNWVYTYPQPWKRTGPGDSADGLGLKFDLNTFDDEYFRRVVHIVELAKTRGIYISLMLFDGWASFRTKYHYTPFTSGNNIQGVGVVDADGDGKQEELQTLDPGHTGIGVGQSKVIVDAEDAYVRHLIDITNSYDNVIYEIANEPAPTSMAWANHFVDLIHTYQQTKPFRHAILLGTYYQYPPSRGINDWLFAGKAEAVSPAFPAASPYDFKMNPPPADGAKVVIADNDHIDPKFTDPTFVWRHFMRGNNPIIVDEDTTPLHRRSRAYEAIRDAMGDTRRYANRIDLLHMAPSTTVCSTQFCLVNPGVEYLVYQPNRGVPFTVDLSRYSGKKFATEWFDTFSRRNSLAVDVAGGAVVTFTPPAASTVIYLKAR